MNSAVYRIGAASFDKERAALLAAKADDSEVRCPDEEATERMKAEIDAARYARDALGGEFIVVAEGCPPGLGSYVDWRQDRSQGRTRVMSINLRAWRLGALGSPEAAPPEAGRDTPRWR